MNIPLLEQEPLARYTSWKIGGPARYFANAQTPTELAEALRWAHMRELAVFTLGGGSNVLIGDNGFSGLVVRYRAGETKIETNGDLVLAQIDAGAPMAGTVRKISRQGLAGLDWAEGLPGTIGGAVFGNAGCYGSDIASSLTRAWLFVNDEIEEWPVAQFNYGYRTSALKRRQQGAGDNGQHGILVRAEFALQRADPVALARAMKERAELRRSKTPQGQSCGSVFKNPPGESAGRLLEAAGMKGIQIGGAAIAEKHANYIVNCGGASADDVLRLVDLAREQVSREFGITLELEVQIIGE